MNTSLIYYFFSYLTVSLVLALVFVHWMRPLSFKLGAVFDFYTGNVKRSHPFFQKMGLEWLPRFLREPRRLWRRNFVSNPVFLLRVIGQRLKR